MGKAKAVIKSSTVDRVTKLINKKYSNKEDLLKSEEYHNLYTQFMNWYEKKHTDTIIDMCYNGNTLDEIRFIIEKGNTEMSNKKQNANYG